jgi:hypothetical protein
MKQILLMIAVVALNLPAFAAGTFIGKVVKITDGGLKIEVDSIVGQS